MDKYLLNMRDKKNILTKCCFNKTQVLNLLPEKQIYRGKHIFQPSHLPNLPLVTGKGCTVTHFDIALS
jgi:hypothetical protein